MTSIATFIKEVVKQIDEGSYDYFKVGEFLSGADKDVRYLKRRLHYIAMNHYDKGEYNSIWSWYRGTEKSNINVLNKRNTCAFTSSMRWRRGFMCYVGEGEDLNEITHTSSFGSLKMYLNVSEPSRAEVGARLWCEALKIAIRKTGLSKLDRAMKVEEREAITRDIRVKMETIWEKLVAKHIEENPIEFSDIEDEMNLYETQIVGSWRTPKLTISFRLGKGTLLYLNKEGFLESPFIEEEEYMDDKFEINISKNPPKGVMLITSEAAESFGAKQVLENSYKLFQHVSSRFDCNNLHLQELATRLVNNFVWESKRRDLAMVVGFCQSVDLDTMTRAYEMFLSQSISTDVCKEK